MNRKERRKALSKDVQHAKFIYKEREKLPVEIKESDDWRTTALITLEWWASTTVKDGSGDIIEPEGIDLVRFEAWNAPLKCMHGRTVISNIGIVKEAFVDDMWWWERWLYIKAEARLDITKNDNGDPINMEDYVLYDRLMNGTVNGFSLWFHDIKGKYDKERGAYVMTYLKLHEVSIVDVSDNPLTVRKALSRFISKYIKMLNVWDFITFKSFGTWSGQVVSMNEDGKKVRIYEGEKATKFVVTITDEEIMEQKSGELTKETTETVTAVITEEGLEEVEEDTEVEDDPSEESELNDGVEEKSLDSTKVKALLDKEKSINEIITDQLEEIYSDYTYVHSIYKSWVVFYVSGSDYDYYAQEVDGDYILQWDPIEVEIERNWVAKSLAENASLTKQIAESDAEKASLKEGVEKALEANEKLMGIVSDLKEKVVSLKSLKVKHWLRLQGDKATDQVEKALGEFI